MIPLRIWGGLALVGVICFVACKANPPGSLEEKATQNSKEVTIEGKNLTNPVPDDRENQKEGAEHFQHHCQICHGLDGQNTGVPFAARMSPPVADLSSKAVQDYSDGQLKWIIENGIRFSGMPAWKGLLDDQEMWRIVRFLRRLPAKGSLGTPKVFGQAAHEHGAAEHKHSH